MALLGACLLAVFGSWIVWKRIVKHWLHKVRLINILPGLTVSIRDIGNALQLRTRSDDFFEQVTAIGTLLPQAPRLLRVWLAWHPYVLVYGAEEAATILTSPVNVNKSREYDLLTPWLGRGLLTEFAVPWRCRRKPLTATFHYDILKDFVEIFQRQAQILCSKLQPYADTTKPVDIYRSITLCALDIITESAMGEAIGAQATPDCDYVTAVHRLNQLVHERQKRPWLWPDVLNNIFGSGREMRWCTDILHRVTDKVIERQRKRRDGDENNNTDSRRMPFIRLLLKLADEGTLGMREVRDDVNTFMFAGHDTTTASLNWTLWLLGLSPEWQQRAQRELDEVLGTSIAIDHTHLSKLVVLESVIKESLRLFPTVPLFARRLDTDIKVKEVIVPAGTVVICNPYAIHRDPLHWPDAERFDPSRFLDTHKIARHPYAYLPFSAGSRNCIGQRFALLEEKTVLATLLRRYTFASVHKRHEVRPTADLVLRPHRGTWVTIESRNIQRERV